MRTNLKLATHRESGTMWISASGDFDLAGEAPFRAALDEFMRQGSARLVVDLRKLNFLDATAIRALLAAAEAMAPNGREPMMVVPGPRRVMRPLEVTGLIEKLNLQEESGSVAKRSSAAYPRTRPSNSSLLDYQKAAYQRVQIAGPRRRVLPRD